MVIISINEKEIGVKINDQNGKITFSKMDPISKQSVTIDLLDLEKNYFKNYRFSKMSQGIQDEPDYSKIEYELNEWNAIKSYNQSPEVRKGQCTSLIDGYIVVYGGCIPDRQCFDTTHFFNLKTHKWEDYTVTGDIPPPRADHACVSAGPKIYVFGGQSLTMMYNDAYEFDMASKSWKLLNLEGDPPRARAGHKAVLNDLAQMFIFGGFDGETYPTNIPAIDLAEKKWIYPNIIGKAPQGREDFAMIYLKQKLWIFGGFILGGVRNDIQVLNLETNTWEENVQQSGKVPSKRQGQSMDKIGSDIILVGGCNYGINECYNDVYILDTNAMSWSQGPQFMNKREGHSLIAIGPTVLLLFGCQPISTCYNDIQIYSYQKQCPDDCNFRGQCRNKRCQCQAQYFDNQCSQIFACKKNCNNNGLCTGEGICSCYGGYKGDDCSQKVECPQNCTLPNQGVCQSNGVCFCSKYYEGDACQYKIDACNPVCENGNCNLKTKKCDCFSGYTGAACDKVPDLSDLNTSQQIIPETDQNLDSIQPIESTLVKPVMMKTVTNYEDFMARKSVEDLEDSLDDNSIEETFAPPQRRQSVPKPASQNKGSQPSKSPNQNVPAQRSPGRGPSQPGKGPSQPGKGPQPNQQQGPPPRGPPPKQDSQGPKGQPPPQIGPSKPQQSSNSQTQSGSLEVKFDLDFKSTNLEQFKQQMLDEFKKAGIDVNDIDDIIFTEGSINAAINCKTEATCKKIEELFRNGKGVGDAVPQITKSSESMSVQKSVDSSQNSAKSSSQDIIQGDESRQLIGRIHPFTFSMFDMIIDTEKQFQEEQNVGSIDGLGNQKLLPIEYCPNQCKNQGICVNEICFCVAGFTGNDCSIEPRSFKTKKTLQSLMITAGITGLIGFGVGLASVVVFMIKVNILNYHDIQTQEENDEDD